MKIFSKINLAFSSLWFSFLMILPDEFSKLRVYYYNRNGGKINVSVSISSNVRIRGRVEMGDGSSISQNSSIYGESTGVFIGKNVMIAANVHIRGRVEMGQGSSIAQNSSISGESAGVFIGKNVMIAPNVVIVAFSHGFKSLEKPMAFQKNTEKAVIIEDDVWIASNCTISKGVRVGKGSIIGANSFVNKDIPPFSIAGGVPVKVIKSRI